LSEIPITNELSDAKFFVAYNQQQKVERGFYFLKDPLFFCVTVIFETSKTDYGSTDVDALVVYGIAERRSKCI
jgi:hypothetical protein